MSPCAFSTPPVISAEQIDAAKERLLLGRQTHLDSLLARLEEERVRRVLAFLPGVVNGKGQVLREDGLGRGRIDLLLRWPYPGPAGRAWQEEALELKVWRDKKGDPLEQGLVQPDSYLDRLGLDHGVLVVFDRRSTGVPLPERLSQESAVSPKGRPVRLLRA